MEKKLLIIAPLLLFYELALGQYTRPDVLTSTDSTEKSIEKINYKNLKKINGRMYRQNASKPYTGNVFELDKNNLLSMSSYFKDGLIRGKQLIFYDDGNVFSEIYYMNGEYHGKYYWYGKDGQKLKESDYNTGVLDGKDIMWYDNGQKWYEVIYVNGQPDSLYLMWHRNGNLAIKGNHINHLRDGQWIWYKESSEINRIEVYKKGIMLSSNKY